MANPSRNAVIREVRQEVAESDWHLRHYAEGVTLDDVCDLACRCLDRAWEVLYDGSDDERNRLRDGVKVDDYFFGLGRACSNIDLDFLESWEIAHDLFYCYALPAACDTTFAVTWDDDASAYVFRLIDEEE